MLHMYACISVNSKKIVVNAVIILVNMCMFLDVLLASENLIYIFFMMESVPCFIRIKVYAFIVKKISV